MNAPVEAGQVLADKYRVERVLGEGGMGVVVAAVDTALERRVAIKFLLPEYSQHREASTRFMREARAAVKIQSEHIARVIDVSAMANGSPYMVMEFLEGGDLAHVLEQRGPLPVDQAVWFVLQAADAIAEAHSYGIVHRDLKPANLFLANQPDGSAKVKVLDFGISKNTLAGTDGTDPSLTRTSSMMGSPLYMSPEQMRSSKDVDARTDIWALGIILYELLTSRLPFDAASIPELSAKILLDQPEPLGRPDVPPELERAVMRCLSKDPNGRFPSIAEMAMAIAPFGPKRGRVIVERISKLLVQAGLSKSALDAPGSIAPPTGAEVPVFAATAFDASHNKPTPRPTETVSEWDTSRGPSAKRPKLSVLLGAVAAVVVVSGGMLAFTLVGSGKSDPEAASSATLAIETVARVTGSEAVVPEATETREPANAPSAEPSTSAAEQPSASAAESPSAAPTPTPTPRITQRPPRRTVVTPRPKPAPRPNPPPTAKKKKTSSLKDQFGGRK
jgi:serine/threonine-protein kinase